MENDKVDCPMLIRRERRFRACQHVFVSHLVGRTAAEQCWLHLPSQTCSHSFLCFPQGNLEARPRAERHPSGHWQISSSVSHCDFFSHITCENTEKAEKLQAILLLLLKEVMLTLNWSLHCQHGRPEPRLPSFQGEPSARAAGQQ